MRNRGLRISFAAAGCSPVEDVFLIRMIHTGIARDLKNSLCEYMILLKFRSFKPSDPRILKL